MICGLEQDVSIGESIGNMLSSAFPDALTPDVELGDFFDPAFMEEYTQFDTFEGFCAESPWRIEDDEDLGDVSTAELDRYVRRTTQFDRWVAMRNRAAGREIRSRLLV